VTDNRLKVWVGTDPVGSLDTSAGRYLFTYAPDCPAVRFISLTMPVRRQTYVWHELHPVFQAGLPGGAWGGLLTDRLARQGRGRPLDALLLWGAGSGRLAVTSDADSEVATPVPRDLGHCMTAADSRLDLGASAESFLGRQGLEPEPPNSALCPTLSDASYHYRPASAARPLERRVEWWCLRIARRAGVEVAGSELARDGRVLRLARTDGVPGARHGREDCAVLQGLGSPQRYASDAWRLVSAAAAFVAPVSRVAARRELFRRLALAARLGDRSVSLRHFALVYDAAESARLAPCDALCTTDLDREASAGRAPLLPGGEQSRPGGVWRRFAAHCALAQREAQAILDWQDAAVAREVPAIEQEVAGDGEGEALLTALKLVWSAAAERLRRAW
jgi:serine/threonine-protein kinase HipA